MFLGNIKNRVDIETMVAKVGLFNLEGSFALLVQFDLVNNV